MEFFSDCREFTLPNGVRAVSLYRPGGAVSIQCLVEAGSMDEGGRAGSGIAHFLEHMLFQGCRGYAGRSGPEKIQRAGGDINAYTSFDKTVLTAKVSAGELSRTLEIFSSMIRTPDIPARRFRAEKKVILRECDRTLDNVWGRLFNCAREVSFAGHPVSLPVIGYRELISEITREDLVDFHRSNYIPQNCIIVAVGEVDGAGFYDCVNRCFGQWQRRAGMRSLPVPVAASGGRKNSIVIPDPQERMLWCMPLGRATDEKMPAMDLMLGLLAGSSNAVLNTEFELKNPLALSMQSGANCFRDGGIATVAASCVPEKFDELKTGVTRLFAEVAEKGFSPDDLAKEILRRKGNELCAAGNLEYLAGQILCGMQYAGRSDFFDHYWKLTTETTLDEINQCAASVLGDMKFDFCSQRVTPVQYSCGVSQNDSKSVKIIDDPDVKIALLPVKKNGMAYGEIIFPGGAVFESDVEKGVSNLLAPLLLCGAAGQDEKGFFDKLDMLSAVVNIHSHPNSFSVGFNSPVETFAETAAMVGRVFAAPGFDDEQLARERIRCVESIRQTYQSPQSLALAQAKNLLYGNHPYAGLDENFDFSGITREKLLDFWETLMVRKQISCAFAGVEENDIPGLRQALFGGIKWTEKSKEVCSEPVFAAGNIRRSFALPREQLAVVRILPGLKKCCGENGLLIMPLFASANGLFSRLFEKVREKNALTYSVGMSYSGGFCHGSIYFCGLTAPGKGEKVEKLFADEIRRLGKKGITAAEFDFAVRRCAFESECQQENPQSMTAAAALDLHYDETPMSPQEKAAYFLSLEYSRVNDFIKNLFSGQKPEIVVHAGAVDKK